MGCGNPDLCIEVITTDQLTWGDVVSIKKTPDICVRRAANILNKHTIHKIVSNLLTTKRIGGFSFEKTGD